MPPPTCVSREDAFRGTAVWVPAFAGTTSSDSFHFPRTALRFRGDDK
jgi:hypothetical protein